VSIIVICRGCGAELDAGATAEGLCAPCRADRACAVDRAELTRLIRKRTRYSAGPGSTDGVDAQLRRVQHRIVGRCTKLAGPGPELAKLVDRQLRLAQEAAISRLVVAS